MNLDQEQVAKRYSHSNGQRDDKCRDNMEAQEDGGEHEDRRSRDGQIHEGIMSNSGILFVEGIEYTSEREREREEFVAVR